MPLVKRTMQQHDGGVKVDSELGVGSTVTLWLPNDVATPIHSDPAQRSDLTSVVERNHH